MQTANTLKKLLFGAAVTALTIGGIPRPVLAETAAPSPSNQTSASNGWRFSLAPYVWGSSLKGTTGAKGISTDVDVSVDEIVNNLDGAFMLASVARYNRLSFSNDLIYMKLSDSSATPKGVAFSSAEMTVSEIAWTSTAGYTVIENDCMDLELLAGLRLASISADLDLEGARLADRSIDAERTWVDPIIGARANIPVSEDWFLRVMGDIGGFGANSALTWQTLGLLGYEISSNVSVAGGYRALGYDHNTDGFKYDIITHGPILGGEFKF